MPWSEPDFYISFGEGPGRNWEDAVKYGFVCGGGGRWDSRTLEQLFVGARVFVNLPGAGYVGVGKVTASTTPVRGFVVEYNGKQVPILKAPLKAKHMKDSADDPDKSEYLACGLTKNSTA